MVDLHKQPGEPEEHFIWRLGQAKDSGILEMDWDELAEIINKEYRDGEEDYRTGCAYRKPYAAAKRYYEAGVFAPEDDPYHLEALKIEQREIKKERQKLRDEKLEYNRWLREQSRDELITEKICEAIRDLPPLEIPEPVTSVGGEDFDFDNKSGVLIFADTHYGAEFTIKGLHGENINEYSPEIFEERMNELFSETLKIIGKERLKEITVYSLGDEIDGILRVSQLMKLRYGVVEATIRYAEYITQWLNNLSKFVKVKFHMVAGNHSELRMLGQPKGTFTKDNMSEIIRTFIDMRLSGKPRFEMVSNKSGLIYDKVQGFDVLGIHGEVKDLAKAVSGFQNIYNANIDILVGGHMHHLKTENIGVNRDVISVPSIIGVDDYSMSLGKASNAGALFLVLEKYKGITCQYNIRFDM